MEDPRLDIPGLPFFPEFEQGESMIKPFLLKMLGKWYWFVLSIVIFVAAAWLLNRYSMPVYQSSSSLLILEKSNASPFSNTESAISSQAFEGFGIMGQGNNIFNQMEMLKSWPIIETAVRELGFEVSVSSEGRILQPEVYTGAPFIVEWDKGHPQLTGLRYRVEYNDGKILVRAEGENVPVHDYASGENIRVIPNVDIDESKAPGEKFIGPEYSFSIRLKEENATGFSGTYIVEFHTVKQVERLYASRLTVAQTNRQTSILKLSVQDHNIQKGNDFLNKLVAVYQQDNLNQKNEVANRTINFIHSQLSEISDSLSLSETEMLQFQSDNRVIDLSAQSQQLLEQMSVLDNQRVVLESQLKYYRYLRNYIIQNQELETIMAPSSMGVEDPLLTGLTQDLNTLTLEKSRLGNVRVSPRLNQINAQIEKLKEALLENVNSSITQAESRLDDLKSRIWASESRVRQLPTTERNMVNIERKYKLNNETYTFMLERLSTAQIAKASNMPDSKVVSEAIFEAQIEPQPMRNYSIAFFLGLMIPALTIFLIDFFTTKVKTLRDVEKMTKLPILASVFYNESKESHNTPVLDLPNSPASEPYRGLRNKLNLMTKGKEKPVVAVTSTGPNEGKSYTAINLASSFALNRKKTVLLDLDLRNSHLSEMLGIDANKGVVNYIMGDVTCDEICFQVKHPNFHVVPAGSIPPNPGEMLTDEKVLILMNELKQKYDVIIIDFAPIGFVTDLFQISEMLDSVLFVVRDRYTDKNWLKSALEELKAHELKGVGLVINGIRMKKGSYLNGGYGYGYGYGYSYGYGYGYGHKKGKNTSGRKVVKTT